MSKRATAWVIWTGSTVTMLGMKYGDAFTAIYREVTKILAIEGWKAALSLSKEKGPRAIMEQLFTVDVKMLHKRPEWLPMVIKLAIRFPANCYTQNIAAICSNWPQEEPALIAELIETARASRITAPLRRPALFPVIG